MGFVSFDSRSEAEAAKNALNVSVMTALLLLPNIILYLLRVLGFLSEKMGGKPRPTCSNISLLFGKIILIATNPARSRTLFLHV